MLIASGPDVAGRVIGGAVDLGLKVPGPGVSRVATEVLLPWRKNWAWLRFLFCFERLQKRRISRLVVGDFKKPFKPGRRDHR